EERRMALCGRDGGGDWYAQIIGEIERPRLPAAPHGKRIESERRTPHAVVPPHRSGIALDQLEQSVQQRLLESVPRGAAGGAGRARPPTRQKGIAIPALARGQPAHPAAGERPERSPFDGLLLLAGRGHEAGAGGPRVP